jgi:hypothetical protein
MTRSTIRWTLAGCVALAALGAAAMFCVAPATADETGSVTSTVTDPVGDSYFPFSTGDNQSPHAAPFLGFVGARLTRKANGDFEMQMEMASPVPAEPPLPQNGVKEIWWFWIFDLDPATRPSGYPWKGANGRPPEFMVCVRWDGAAFSGTAIDRRPLLTGGEAIVHSVPFSIDGTKVRACLAHELIGDIPASFGWGPFTFLWKGPVESEGVHFADYCETGGVFNP